MEIRQINANVSGINANVSLNTLSHSSFLALKVDAQMPGPIRQLEVQFSNCIFHKDTLLNAFLSSETEKKVDGHLQN